MNTTATKTYSSKGNAKKAAQRDGVTDPVLTQTDTGWAWSAPDAHADPVEQTMAELDAAEARARSGVSDEDVQIGDADTELALMDDDADTFDAEQVGADAAALFASTETADDQGRALVMVKNIAGQPVAVDPNNPLVFNGVLYGNKARVSEARRLHADREARPAAPAKAAKAPAAPKAPKAPAADKGPSKANQLVDLAKRPEGVTADEIRTLTGWTKLGGLYGAVARVGLTLHSMRDGATTRFFAFDAATEEGTRAYVRTEAGGSWTFVGLADSEQAALDLAGGRADFAVDTGKGGQFLIAPRAAVA